MSNVEDDDKKKLAKLLEEHGDRSRDFNVRMIQQTLRMFSDGIAKITSQYEHDEWAREWVDLVKRAVADLRVAESRVQIQPFAPHGKVPS